MIEIILVFVGLSFLFAFLYSKAPEASTASGIIYRMLFLFMALYAGYTGLWMAQHNTDLTTRTEAFVYENRTITVNATACQGGILAADGSCSGTLINTVQLESVPVAINSTISETTRLSSDSAAVALSFLDSYNWAIYLILAIIMLFFIYNSVITFLGSRQEGGTA